VSGTSGLARASPVEDTRGLCYLDWAATSFPKAPGVAEAVSRFLTEVGANPGRSAHRLSIAAARIVFEARERVARLFQVSDSRRVILLKNATEGLNLVIAALPPAGRAIVSGMEHNAVMRPLRWLEAGRGLRIEVLPRGPRGPLDYDALERALREPADLVVLCHASNVTGEIVDLERAAAIPRGRARLLVDAAQTAGSVPLDMESGGIDLLAFTGHKSLLGPMGTGGLAIGERVDPGRFRPLKLGGTGSQSEKEEQPAFLPDLGESGTPNAVGLAGLEAGIRWVLDRGIASIRRREIDLAQRLIDGLRAIPGVRVFGLGDASRSAAIVSFAIAGISPSDVAFRLDERYGILCRAGLHCAPAAHRTIGTFPAGTVRFAPGPFTTRDDADAAIAAVREIAREGR